MVDYLSRKRSKFKLRWFGLNYDVVFEDGGPNYILIKLMLFHLYVFFGDYVITIWPAADQIVTSIIILSHTVVYIQFPPLEMFPSISPRWSNALAFTTNSIFPQLLTRISTIKHFQISYIYNENRTTFATFSLVTSSTVVPSE